MGSAFITPIYQFVFAKMCDQFSNEDWPFRRLPISGCLHSRWLNNPVFSSIIERRDVGPTRQSIGVRLSHERVLHGC